MDTSLHSVWQNLGLLLEFCGDDKNHQHNKISHYAKFIIMTSSSSIHKINYYSKIYQHKHDKPFMINSSAQTQQATMTSSSAQIKWQKNSQQVHQHTQNGEKFKA